MNSISSLLNSLRIRLRDPLLALHEAWFFFQRKVLNKGTNVMEEDWDNLVILDACRYDVFEQKSTLPGTLTSKVSVGSGTPQFLHRNFDGIDFSDTVLITATPHSTDINPGVEFHERIRVYEDGEPPFPDAHPEYEVVLPEQMGDAVVDAAEEFPNKRIIAHFLQPHAPFIGETGEEIFSEEILYSDRLKNGEISAADARRAYEENVELILPHVERSLESLPGKTVVTADHGEMFGKLGVYGHAYRYPEWDPEAIRDTESRSNHRFGRLYLRDLVEVPWLTTHNGERKEITRGSADDEDREVEEEKTREQLRNLGYIVD
jgi:hypothetical protein